MGHKYRISQECREWAIGREWTFARFTRRVWEDVARYGRSLLPNPLKEVLAVIADANVSDAETLRRVQADDAKEIQAAKQENREPTLVAMRFRAIADALADKALEKATSYISAQSRELASLLSSHEGGAYLFWLLLKPAHPEITEAEAFDVYWDLEMNGGEDGRKKVQEIIAVCNGSAPECVKNGSPPAV